MHPKPDFSKMNGQQLLDTYNMYAPKSRSAKFQDKQEGVARCEAEWVKWDKANPNHPDRAKSLALTTTTTPAASAPVGPKVEDKNMAKTATAAAKAAPKTETKKTAAKAPSKPKTAPASNKAKAKAEKQKDRPERRKPESLQGRNRRSYDIIQRKAKVNPRREGSLSHDFFEEMVDGRTVGEYLDQFDDSERRNASQWLSNSIAEGHITIKYGEPPAESAK